MILNLTADELTALVAALRPLARAAHEHAGATPNVAPAPRDERVSKLIIDVATQQEALDTVMDELLALRKLVLGMGDRLHAQAELLAKRAEAKPPDALDGLDPVWTDTPDALPTRLTGPDPTEPAPTIRVDAPPSANGHAAPESHPTGALHGHRLEVARLLAARPMTQGELCEALGKKSGWVSRLLSVCSWWDRGDGWPAPYTLTDAGRAALAQAGYVLVSAVAPASESAAESGLIPEPAAEISPPPETPQDRAAHQCREMARTLRTQGKPLLPDEIARTSGLPLEAVQRRLRTNGPQAIPSAPRYFTTSAREPGAYVLTNSGDQLAREEGPG